MTNAATPVTDATFEAEVIAASQPVVVDFWAPWCGPCKRVGPVLDTLATQHPSIRVVTVDVDDNPMTQNRYRIMSVPTVMLFVDGEPVVTVLGVKSVKALTKAFGGHL